MLPTRPLPVVAAAVLAVVFAVGLANAGPVPAILRQPVPAWVQLGKTYSVWRGEQTRNVERVAAANKSKKPLDFVMYGDSNSAWWNMQRTAWGKAFGKYQTLLLGMTGSTVEALTWRIIKGGENPQRSPKAIAFLIGINNIYYNNATAPRQNLSYMARWTKARHPSSKIVLLRLLPSVVGNATLWDQSAADSQAVARLVDGLYLDCNKGLDPTNKLQYSDGIHLTASGLDQLYSCLRAAVVKYL